MGPRVKREQRARLCWRCIDRWHLDPRLARQPIERALPYRLGAKTIFELTSEGGH